MKLAAMIVPLTVTVGVLGCGGGDQPETTTAAQAIPTAQCKRAMGGTPSRSWRRDATATGPIGFFGSGRNFLSRRFTKRTKSPLILEGHDPVTLSIGPRDRWHARLLAPTPAPFAPYVEIRFVPCRDQARTIWPAGFQLRNRQPVTLVVRQAGEPARTLRVGRI